MGQIIRVPIAGSGVGHKNDTLFTVVGSCVAIMLYDKKHLIGGMIHVMLGHARNHSDNPTKYADTGIPYLIHQMTQNGASAHRLVGAKISGGGEMFDVLNTENSVSRNNVKIVKEILQQLNIKVIAEDCGGKTGRRITFDMESGKVIIVMKGRSDLIL